ncbi:MAG: hypothetical protein PHQ40_05565 [Anaerolineaceae bacterium]|nr:hypothetical protein [Anaerolineaceae bacterium]
MEGKITTFKQAKQRLIELIGSTKSELSYDASKGYQGVNDPLAVGLGIDIEERKSDFDYGGYLPAEPPLRPKPKIYIDPTDSDQDHINFTYFHEISHHLIRLDGDLYSFLSDLAVQNKDFDKLVDGFADIGSAEFLIPRDRIFSILHEKGFSVRLIPDLDVMFPASKPAIMIQLAQCTSHKCFVAICKYGLPPRSKSKSINQLLESVNRPHLFVEYWSESPSQDRYGIARYTSIAGDHLILNAYQCQGYIKGVDRIPLRSGKVWMTECEALYFKGKVYATFNLSPVPVATPDQLQLF